MRNIFLSLLAGCLVFLAETAFSQHSIAREWNEITLNAIRSDFARPTVHARNLFHTSLAMYEAWAAYDDVAAFYLLGRPRNGYFPEFTNFPLPDDIEAARKEAISYAIYRVLTYRFANSPGQPSIQIEFDQFMNDLGYDKDYRIMSYQNGNPASLGNYIGQVVIDYGKLDHSNETNDYENAFYEPVNDPMVLTQSGNPTLEDPNRWQPLAFETFIDQGGNEIIGSVPDFLSPEWGNVFPFALRNHDLTVYERDGHEYKVFHDPLAPPYLDQTEVTDESTAYKWGFELVTVWSSHLDPYDGDSIDISPASIGNNAALPETIEDYSNFYDLINGGDASQGHNINPITNAPYQTQKVPRGDYTRVLAEFWADGPDSETPPGHWFTILNYVNDQPLLEKKFKGEGDVLDDLAWDIKAYFALGGAMHDAAVSAWGVKGWYDYIRPISALRYMADRGQSSDPELPSYHIEGIPLIEGYVELVNTGDPLAGNANQNVGKIKLNAWKGHAYILDPETDAAGVGWILAELWAPYQRNSFVTPPFAGYVSGHSTFSRAAAEVLTLMTGDPYFPGGMGEFFAPQDEFLVFENGPSTDLTLQWATYRDASDQCSLSRIWGGIHPPADDIPGRKMGIVIGTDAFAFAESFFTGNVLNTPSPIEKVMDIYPNPITAERVLNISSLHLNDKISLINLQGQIVKTIINPVNAQSKNVRLELHDIDKGIYILKVNQTSHKIIVH